MRILILGIEQAENSEKDEVFRIKLEDAKNIVLDKVYPFNQDISELPERLKNWQLRAAVELYQRTGEEGITSYSENGLSYSYKTDLLSEELIHELPPPYAGVIS